MLKRVRRLAGQCLLVKCPDTSRRSCRRKRKGEGGTCRIWPECRCIRAAGGIRICLVRQILPSLSLPFSSTASNACFMDFSPADIVPPGAGLALAFAGCIQSVGKSTSTEGISDRCSGCVLATRERFYVRKDLVCSARQSDELSRRDHGLLSF